MEVALGWKPISDEELIVFFGQTISMGLIIKGSMKASEILKVGLREATRFVLEQFLVETGYPTDAPIYVRFSRKPRR